LIDAAGCIRSHPVSDEIQLGSEINSSFGKDGDLILSVPYNLEWPFGPGLKDKFSQVINK
jgi:hypothetical protein